MDVTILSAVKPYQGSGDGMTEYAYRLEKLLPEQGVRVSSRYALQEAKKDDIFGVIYTQTIFRMKIASMAKGDSNIMHILNQEIGFAARILKGKFHGRIVSTINDLSRFDPSTHTGAMQNLYNELVKNNTTEAVENSDFLVFISSIVKKDAEKHFGKIRDCAVINDGVSAEFISKKKVPKKPSSKFEVGYIGSFAHHKNVMFIAKTASKIGQERDITFSIYGKGLEEGIIRDYITSNNLSNMRICGFAPEKEKIKTYDSFDAFIFPSFHEGFGLPILEAQSRGLPVIIYKKAHISKEVRKHCIEAENPEHAAQIIENLKENGYNEKKRKEAMAYARSFTWEKTARETLGIYKKMLK